MGALTQHLVLLTPPTFRNSTKTVVSVMDQSGTFEAAELASSLKTLDQLCGGQTPSVSYPDVMEDSISSNLATEGQLGLRQGELLTWISGAGQLLKVNQMFLGQHVSCPEHFGCSEASSTFILGRRICLKKMIQSQVTVTNPTEDAVIVNIFCEINIGISNSDQN